MNGDRTIMVEILNAIEYGNLSVDETRRRLERLIDIEIEKTDAPANKPLVEECEKLLWELNTNGKLPFVSHLEENQSAVLRDFRNHQNLRMFGKYALRIGIVAAALFVFAIGAEVLLHREWLDTTTSSDGEQFIIYGEAVKKQYMWMQGPCVYSVGGHISLDEVKGIISQILGE